MEWFVQNFELIVYIALLLIITLIIVVIVLSRRLTVFFTNAKFKIQSQYVVDPTTKEKYISLTVYNNNLNDSRMTGLVSFMRNKTLIIIDPTLLLKNLMRVSN